MSTPFYPILLKQFATEPKSRAELKILSDYIISIPKFQNKVIADWIKEIEESDEEIELPDA